ncbi:MAG: glycosyltransferase family 4 protein [Bacteroidales bacterium]|nr:glycosyltransferase family 4 protein [Clostridium sp.]MCM1203292.1 glycosyltransferase family 4 protein [Bacteroidales bacterium]
MKKWVTLFFNTYNEQLRKDVGMIPYFFSQLYGYNSTLVTYQKEKEYPYYISGKGFNLFFLKGKREHKLKDGILYLIKYSKEIDVLNLYHWGRLTLIFSQIYHFFNPKGLVYVKLDMDYRGIETLQGNRRARRVFKKILKSADVITAESVHIQKELADKFGFYVSYLPNGYWWENENLEIQLSKKKELLTVGRLGTEQKATENLLAAFAMIADDIKDWNLILVGSVEEGFKQYIEDYYLKYPNLKKRVVFEGKIVNRKDLLKKYLDAAIFVLPSRWEGFALVLLEAMSAGCYVIGTETIAPIRDIIRDDSVGMIVRSDDVNDLAMKIEHSCKKNSSINCYNIQKYCCDNYTWENVCRKLELLIDNKS